MIKKLKDQTILITGATGGIGRAFAELASESGANLVLVARNAARLDAAIAEFRAAGPVRGYVADLASENSTRDLLSRLDRDQVEVDILINNAGAGTSGPFAEDDPGKIEAMLRLNVIGLTQLTHWAAHQMAARRSGRIVNLSAAVATRPVPNFAAYSASKAYVTHLSLALANELRPYGVKVTAVHPPAVKTNFAADDNAALTSTWVWKLFSPLGPSARGVAASAYRAALADRSVVNVGPLAWAIYRSGFIMPNALDLPIMNFLFRHASGKAASSTGLHRSLA